VDQAERKTAVSKISPWRALRAHLIGRLNELPIEVDLIGGGSENWRDGGAPT